LKRWGLGVGEAVDGLIVTKSEIASMRLNMRGGERRGGSTFYDIGDIFYVNGTAIGFSS
jgi:hypothetical protein